LVGLYTGERTRSHEIARGRSAVSRAFGSLRVGVAAGGTWSARSAATTYPHSPTGAIACTSKLSPWWVSSGCRGKTAEPSRCRTRRYLRAGGEKTRVAMPAERSEVSGSGRVGVGLGTRVSVRVAGDAHLSRRQWGEPRVPGCVPRRAAAHRGVYGASGA
jgi:hypothetical protein